MIALRPYQRLAVDSIFEYFQKNNGHPIVSMPTASGKSVVQAAFISETLKQWPSERFLLVSHVKELLIQNSSKLQALGVDCGIYSAGLKQRDIKQVTVAGVQSIYKRAHEMGEVSIVIVDECHLISKTDETMYRRFFKELMRYCPHVKIVGLSATPFRLDSGPLIKGDNRLFTDICFSVSMLDLIEQGYLSPIRTAHVKKRVSADEVKKRGGEYIAGDLEAFMNKEQITNTALDEVQVLCADRKSWLVFCSGVKHAASVANAIRARGYTAEAVTGETSSAEREQHLSAFKRGEIRALVSVGILTTGFDAPCADALICLRPTCSPGLWLQLTGRITRLHPGKIDGLVVDFTENTKTHGPVDEISIDGDGNVKTAPCRICIYCQGLIPPKEKKCPDCGREQGRVCPACSCPMDFGVTQCPGCGLETVRKPREPKHNVTASDAPILSSQAKTVDVVEVKSIDVKRHKKEGKPDSVRVRYWCGLAYYDDWLCFDHGGYARDKARLWWRWGVAPRTTEEALSRASEIVAPQKITVKKDGKYWRVISRSY